MMSTIIVSLNFMSYSLSSLSKKITNYKRSNYEIKFFEKK